MVIIVIIATNAKTRIVTRSNPITVLPTALQPTTSDPRLSVGNSQPCCLRIRLLFDDVSRWNPGDESDRFRHQTFHRHFQPARQIEQHTQRRRT